MSNSTEAKVFIIESLEFKDEERERFEGHIISNILQMSNIETRYYYVRTKKEFKEVLRFLDSSNFRYLHISCHGGENAIWTTLDEIPNKELGAMLKASLYHKRLFLSACAAVNDDLANEVIPVSNCYSIIGPQDNIEFRDAAIMWASFYHLMFKMDSRRMDRNGLMKNMQRVVNAFEQSLNFYSISAKSPKGFKVNLISPQIINVDIDDEDPDY